jgi:S-adenosylmethionine-dependent methyltransferase
LFAVKYIFADSSPWIQQNRNNEPHVTALKVQREYTRRIVRIYGATSDFDLPFINTDYDCSEPCGNFDWGFMNTNLKAENRFENDASRYAAYLETPEGRLRRDLTLAGLQEFLPSCLTVERPHALDLGGGTGVASIWLARAGFHVTLLDSSAAMLDRAKQTIIDSGLADKITIKRADVTEVTTVLAQQSFSVVLCHNLLEYVDDPEAVLHDLTRLMHEGSSILSILVRNQAGEILKSALQSGDLAAAEEKLSADWGTESLYGGKVRFFAPGMLQVMLERASLTVIARRGVRVLSDYLPTTVSRSADYERVFAFERKLSTRDEFFGIARYLHYLVRTEAKVGK